MFYVNMVGNPIHFQYLPRVVSRWSLNAWITYILPVEGAQRRRSALPSDENNMAASSVFRPGLFSQKVAIVTGGGTGIGKAISAELLELGEWFCFLNIKLQVQKQRNLGALWPSRTWTSLTLESCHSTVEIVDCCITPGLIANANIKCVFFTLWAMDCTESFHRVSWWINTESASQWIPYKLQTHSSTFTCAGISALLIEFSVMKIIPIHAVSSLLL